MNLWNGIRETKTKREYEKQKQRGNMINKDEMRNKIDKEEI